MKAFVYEKYGSPEVLELRDIPTPTPKNNEILIKIQAASVNAYDWHFMRAEPAIARLSMGLFKPKLPIMGADIAGIVEAVGPDAAQFKPGDRVYGDLSANGNGGFAQYVTVPETAMAHMPAGSTFEEAAAVPMAAVTALQGLRDQGQIQAGTGQKVLINGASGGVGTFAVQLAKSFGAEVTAVCSTQKTEQARNLGADHVIDYTQEDFAQNGQQYDIILAVNGYRSMADYKRSLSQNGIYVMAGGTNAQIFGSLILAPFYSMGSSKKMTTVSAKSNQADLIYLRELIEAGKVQPVIDKCYPFSALPDALRYVDEGHASGKVVISMAELNEAHKSR